MTDSEPIRGATDLRQPLHACKEIRKKKRPHKNDFRGRAICRTALNCSSCSSYQFSGFSDADGCEKRGKFSGALAFTPTGTITDVTDLCYFINDSCQGIELVIKIVTVVLGRSVSINGKFKTT